MRRIFCDVPDCGREITSEDRFIIEVSKFTPEKLVPAMQGMEVCAQCKENLKFVVHRLTAVTALAQK